MELSGFEKMLSIVVCQLPIIGYPSNLVNANTSITFVTVLAASSPDDGSILTPFIYLT
jgi:hypothetical protein